MRLLLDDTSNRGSDAGYGVGKTVPETDQTLFNDDDGYQSLNAGQQTNPDFESYNSNNPAGGRPSVFEDSGYDSPNYRNYSDPEFQAYQEAQRRSSLIDEAKRGMKRAKAVAQRSVPKKIGEAMGDKQMFMGDSEKDRDLAKDKVKQKARDYLSDKIGDKIGDEAIKKGFQKGLSKGAKGLAKEGAKDAAKTATKAATKGAAQAGSKVAAEGAIAGAEGAVDVLGAATGFETFGLGFILAILLNIAISLGVSDAVDAAFELKDGDFKKAYFLAVRGASKVGMFIVLLLSLVTVFSIGGIIFAIPILLALNIYMLLGFAFKSIPQLQGLVWWEIIIIIVVDVMAFIILMAFLGALGWYLCSGIGGGGAVTTAITTVYDWWNKSNLGSVADTFCKYVNTATQ